MKSQLHLGFTETCVILENPESLGLIFLRWVLKSLSFEAEIRDVFFGGCVGREIIGGYEKSAC